MEHYLDQAPCLYFSATDDGVLVDVNEKLCTSLGHSRCDLAGQKADVLFTLPTRIFNQTHFFPLLKMQGHAEEIFITLQKKSGETLPVLINAERKTIDGKNLNLFAGIIVENRKKFEEELIAAKKTAEAALQENTVLTQARQELQTYAEQLDEKMYQVNKHNEELRQFNRVVTHDVQEPLRKLSVFSNMLLEDEGKLQQKNIAAKIHKVTDQLRNIISGLQQYVWLNETPPRFTQIEPEKLLLTVLQQLKKDYPDVDLHLDYQHLKGFYGDWEQVHLLFYQLLSNAIRFKKESESVYVTIRTSTLQLNRFRAIEGRYKYVDFLRILIADKGKGFNSVYKDQVFELFKRLHVESGSGVGLSLCRKVVDNHGGSISIDSQTDKGTTVTILLPLDRIDTDETTMAQEHRNSSTNETINTNAFK